MKSASPEKSSFTLTFSARHLFAAGLIICLLLPIDMITKYLTHTYLPLRSWYYPYCGIAVFENIAGVQFSIVHATNQGAAWGILSDYQIPLLIARILLVALLLFYLIFSTSHVSWRLPGSLIIAGAVGNILDFFIYGHVVDMFYFVLWGYSYPVFNVADIAIFCGVCWLLILSFFSEQTEQK